MAKLLAIKEGKQVFGYDFPDFEVKSISDYEIELIGSTEKRDRDGDVIEAAGWELKNFKKNPVILPSHMYWEPAIARAKSVKVDDGKLRFRIEFPEEGVNPVADVYRKLYKGGFMKASSVGFVPTEWASGDGEKEPRRTYKKQELLELSLVSVPSNPEALTEERGIREAISKGVITNDEVETLKTAVLNSSKKGGDPNALELQEPGDPATTKDKGGEPRKTEKEEEKGLTEQQKAEVRQLIVDTIVELKSNDLYDKMIFGQSGEQRQQDANEEQEVEISTDELKDLVKGVLNNG